MEISANDSRTTCQSILVVEDDEAISGALKFALELEGYKVFIASNGQEAVVMFETIPKPCLILLDLMMPVMNGWEFAEHLEKDELLANIPIVVVTAFADKAKIVRAKKIIKKPVDWDELYEVVKVWCPAI